MVPSALVVTTTPSQNDKKIEDLTNMMRTLALSIRTLQGNAGATLNISQPEHLSTNAPPEPCMQTNSRGSGSGKGWPEGVNRYMYCWQSDHYLKRHCQAFQDDLNSNRIHLGDESRVCLGAYLPGVRPVFMRREKPGRESVADAEKLCYPTVLKYDCKDQTFSY